MRVIRWWGEPLNELVDRLFSLEGKADAIKRATRSIVEANLHLPLGAGDAQEESMVPGSVIAVPPVPGATLRDSVQPVSVAVADSLLAKLQSALPSVSTELERADARALDASANVLDALKDRELRKAAETDPMLAEAIDRSGEAVTARREQVEQVASEREAALTAVEETIGRLLELAAAGTKSEV